MARSKIDRLDDFYAQRVSEAIDRCKLRMLEDGNAASATRLEEIRTMLVSQTRSYGTYSRLELSDIIKGHKRAWPDVEAP